MGKGFVDTVAVRIEEGEDWVEIKPKLGLGDRARFTDHIYRMGRDEKTDGLGMRVALGDVSRLMLSLSVVAWSWPEPVSEAQIDKIDMDEPIWAKVLEAVQERNPTLMELRGVAG